MEKFWPDIIKDLKGLLETSGTHDVLIQAGEDSNYLELHAHSLILRGRSQYFRNAFAHNSFEITDEKYIIRRPDITPKSFNNILYYLYIGDVTLDKDDDGVEILNLWLASNELGLHELSNHVQGFFKQYQLHFFKKHPVEMIDMIFSHDLFSYLRDFCLETLCAEPLILIGTDQFKLLSEEVLIQLLKRDDLSLRGISIWDNILLWCFGKNPTLVKDVNEWTRDDTDLMKNTIGNLIPLIKFHDISAEDFFNKVLPYEELIPRNIRHEILRAHMLPSRPPSTVSDPNLSRMVNGSTHHTTLPSIDSEIITSQHVILFSSWIDRRSNPNYTNINEVPYEFNLLLRGTRDGMDPQTFHKLCDNKGPTFIVIKIKNSKQITGGYNPLDWDSNDRSRNSTDSFIFSFRVFDDFNTAVIGRVKPNEVSVRCYREWGAIFGNYDGGNDLVMKRKAEWKSKPTSYPDVKIPRKFNCTEYEVFQIKRIV
ncbi:hypothetical protein RclHR1_00160022 [Rhizophagus clarus]|uniref:BTB domain-containing protein n=1 Tax=Rhizophagus clarus TaxID=94130 RepID=A0A2Z6R9A3_9GLOM|nr:hypothetical protein RclHR1_00160022 [Rhizophagus clarus]GES81092.1 hypothetical protein GLOIN_2v1766017 [Rhizophagus clarus]